MDHGALRELAAGAALEDLDPLERIALDKHLATCPDCLALAAELDQLMADLALVAEEREPPTTLHRDVLEAIRSGNAASSPLALPRTGTPALTPMRPAASRRAARLPALVGLAAAAAFAVIAVALAARAQSLEADLAAARGELARDQAVLAVAADPSHRTAGLHAPTGPSATVVWVPGTEDAFLVSHNLPATPAGQVYQLWHADEAGVHPLGTFTHDGEGPLVAAFGVDLAASSAAMVTLEPPGGAGAEPGPEVVFGELQGSPDL